MEALKRYFEAHPLTPVEQVISRAMALQVIHGWPMKEAVAEAVREVTA